MTTTLTPTPAQIRASLARDSLAWFMRAHGEEPDPWQARVLLPLLETLGRGEGRRILLHAPPQTGKSLPASRRFPAWHLGRNPLARVVGSAYSVQFARDSFGEAVRNLMAGDAYRDIFPHSAIEGRASAESFDTPARRARHDGNASYLAVGSRSGFTGRGLEAGDVFLFDDPYASPEEARSVADNERVWRFLLDIQDRVRGGADLLVLFHRYHDDDLAARAQASGGWEVVRCPALADDGQDDPTHVVNGGWRRAGDPLSPRLSVAKCEEVRERDPHRFAGLYQGLPRPVAGGLIRPDRFTRIEALPDLTTFARGWDFATSERERADDTASAFGGIEPGGRLVLGEVERFRLEWPDARARIVATATSDLAWCEARGAEILYGVETFGQQGALLSDLRRLEPFRGGRVRLVPLRPRGDKRQKASRWAANAALGLVAYCPRGPRGAWDVEGFFSECRAFSGARTDIDNRVDAVSLLAHLHTNRHGQLHDEDPNPILDRIRREQSVYDR